MAFLQSCFIYKNTPELRQFLDKIGYKYGGKASKFEQPYLYCSLDKYFECNSFPARYHSIIDCGTNEKLFFALSALNDRTDFMQWFVSESGNWFLCVVEKFDINLANWLNCDRQNEWNKATVKELIEHFSK